MKGVSQVHDTTKAGRFVVASVLSIAIGFHPEHSAQSIVMRNVDRSSGGTPKGLHSLRLLFTGAIARSALRVDDSPYNDKFL